MTLSIDTSKKISPRFSPAEAMEREFFPVVRAAYENYRQKGVIPSIYSCCFASDREKIHKLFCSYGGKVTLREKVDAKKLQAAVDKAVEICPYAAFEVCQENGTVVFRRNNAPLLVGNFEKFGTVENNNHYAIISCEGKEITMNFAHVLTDAFGTKFFLKTMLNFYFEQNEELFDGADKFDFVADLMARDLPLPADYEPKSYKVADCFSPPERDFAVKDKTFGYTVEGEASKFKDFCNRYSISAQRAVSFLLAKAIQMTHPENKRVISVRGPVDTRNILQTPNTFQNASVPHIFLNIDPAWLGDTLPEEAIRSVNREFNEQCTYENLAAYTNWCRRGIISPDENERQNIFMSYKKQTDIFANYMGNTIDKNFLKYIESYIQVVNAFYPLMLYANKFGDKIIFQFAQTFETPVYAKNFSKILESLGGRCK